MLRIILAAAIIFLLVRTRTLARDDTDGRGCMGAILLAAAVTVLGYWFVVN